MRVHGGRVGLQARFPHERCGNYCWPGGVGKRPRTLPKRPPFLGKSVRRYRRPTLLESRNTEKREGGGVWGGTLGRWSPPKKRLSSGGFAIALSRCTARGYTKRNRRTRAGPSLCGVASGADRLGWPLGGFPRVGMAAFLGPWRRLGVFDRRLPGTKKADSQGGTALVSRTLTNADTRPPCLKSGPARPHPQQPRNLRVAETPGGCG